LISRGKTFMPNSTFDLLAAVGAGDVYQVCQRTATYAMNYHTGHRVTRGIRPLERDGLVYLTDYSRDGLTRDYGLTDAGRVRLAASRSEEQQ
jgi:hypothetical protein